MILVAICDSAPYGASYRTGDAFFLYKHEVDMYNYGAAIYAMPLQGPMKNEVYISSSHTDFKKTNKDILNGEQKKRLLKLIMDA